MADIKKTKDDALAIINAALTILDRFPEFDETNTTLSYNTSLNPFTFLMDAFKATAGYNVFLKIISGFIASALPVVELSVKGILLAKIKNLLTCSINPFISYDLLKNGIVFDLRTLDITNKLYYCPLEDIGKYYYFGCDGFAITDELVRAGDFDAFLWYTKNRSQRRQVWYGVNIITSNIDSMFTEDEDGNSLILQKEPESIIPTKGGGKCKKKNGIITIQYRERPTSLRDAEGNSASYQQLPHNDCLQVFIGNTQDTVTLITDLENEISDLDKEIAEAKSNIEILDNEIIGINENLDFYFEQFSNQLIPYEEYIAVYDDLNAQKNSKLEDISAHESAIDSMITDKLSKQRQLKAALAALANLDSPSNYRNVEQNYYYGRTLIEFNTDYVMSLKLFDSKGVAAQLIDALTGCLSIDLNLSYEQLLVKYETQKMVKSVVETDDSVVSDCFFTFSNNEYDKMLQKAELSREGLFAMNTNNPTGVKIDASEILDKINNINEGSSKETVQSVIEGGLTEISKMLSDVEYEGKEKVGFGAEINFIENIMNNLAYVITSAVISPKLYLLLAVNLKILGEQTSFSLNDFIDKYRQMIVEIIRSIRDMIIQYLVDELMKILADLSKEVAIKLTIEQAEYYRRLIKRLIDCFRSEGRGVGFDIDDVDYADIIQEAEAPIENEC